jgi:hypothetical protein
LNDALDNVDIIEMIVIDSIKMSLLQKSLWVAKWGGFSLHLAAPKSFSTDSIYG